MTDGFEVPDAAATVLLPAVVARVTALADKLGVGHAEVFDTRRLSVASGVPEAVVKALLSGRRAGEPDVQARFLQRLDLLRRTRLKPNGRKYTQQEIADGAGMSRQQAGALINNINLTGTFLLTHAVVPVMKRQRSGKIINISSIAGRGVSRSSSSAYATAKGGIIALTRKLAFELGPHGITVNAIAPSLTLSERIRPHWERRSAEGQAAEIERTPLGRVATPEDQARVICFLASSDADFVSGVTIDVTGGQ